MGVNNLHFYKSTIEIKFLPIKNRNFKITRMSNQKYSQGQHPNSLSNLTYRQGRKRDFGQRKKTRGVSLTDEGWENIKLLASKQGCSSVSDFLEKIARGIIKLEFSA